MDNKPIEPPVYLDGKQTDHRMEGTVIPRSRARDQNDSLRQLPSLAGDVGATFDLKAPYPQNIIAMDDKGQVTESFQLTPEAVFEMRKHHEKSGKPALNFAEAAAKVKNQPVKQAVNTGVIQPVKAAEKTSSDESLSVSRELQEPRMTELDLLGAGSRQKVKVRFTGAFGGLTVFYNSVYRHDIFLVMVQYAGDGQFYEAPSGDQQVLVETPDGRYTCYPGPQFPLAQDSKLMVTVYIIEEAE